MLIILIPSLPWRKVVHTENDPRGYSTLYDTKKRLASYWHQLDEVRQARVKRVLEIGTGSGFVARQLAPYYLLTTLDTSIERRPDSVGSVLSLPFKNNSFELVLCCQVLEHLPFSNFGDSLKEIKRVVSKRVVLSLPDKKPFIPIQLPRIGRRKFPHPFFKPLKHAFDGQHHWEVNAVGYESKKIVEAIQKYGFKILKDYQVFENFKHHFFVLEES